EHALELIADSMPDLERAKSYPAFRRYLRQRLLSFEGRCFRLWLRTAPQLDTRRGNRGIQLAPAESLAFRTEIRGKDWRFTGLPLGQLCRDFFDGRKPGFVPKASNLKLKMAS